MPKIGRVKRCWFLMETLWLEGQAYLPVSNVERHGYECRDESFSVYLLLFTVRIPACSFGFMPVVKPAMSIKVSLTSQGITVTEAFLHLSHSVSLGQERLLI